MSYSIHDLYQDVRKAKDLDSFIANLKDKKDWHEPKVFAFLLYLIQQVSSNPNSIISALAEMLTYSDTVVSFIEKSEHSINVSNNLPDNVDVIIKPSGF